MTALLVGVFIVASALAQITAPHDLVAALRSQDPAVRGPAVVSLEVASVSLLSRSDVQEAVIEALVAENRLIRENYDAFVHGRPQVLADEGHDYYSDLVTVAMRMLDILPPPAALRSRLVEELVGSAYNPDSRLARRLALEGEAIVEPVLQLALAPREPCRWNAYSLIELVFRGGETGTLHARLTPASRDRLRVAARQGLRDVAAGVRKRAIAATVAARDTGALPVLEAMARNDPDSGDGRPPLIARDSVRRRAAAAVAILRSEKGIRRQ